MKPEPHNPYDSKAIAFECMTNEDKRIVYMVSDVQVDVHLAINDKSIVSVEVEWIRFITHWSCSKPGWYCGITIKKKGPWSKVCLNSHSTF